MAGLTLKHIYKVYPGKKGTVKAAIKRKLSKKKKDAPETKKRSGDFVAVKDFNMVIEDGEFIVLVGPSGCGKSTTIRMIAGLEDISSGELYIDGELVNEVAAKDRDIAMVFQSYALYPHMTAEKNIAFALKLRKIPVERKDKEGNPVIGIDEKKIKEINRKIRDLKLDIKFAEMDGESDEYKQSLANRMQVLTDQLAYYTETPVQLYKYRHMTRKEIAEKVQWAAHILGIEELLDSKPAEMSGGQRQRVALGRAMVRGPKVFLLDEPLSNLDAKLRASMRLEIVKLHKALKTTFIYVTHDQIEAMTMGTRIVVMKLGVVQQIDTPTNLYDYPGNKFVAGFIGTPQMNFFEVTVQWADGKLLTTFPNGEQVVLDLAKLRTFDPAATERYLDGEPHRATLGLRGEHLRFAEGKSPITLTATLSVKEVLGNTTQMFVKLAEGGPDYIFSVPDRNEFVAGDTILVTFDEKNVHLFDPDTEESLLGRTFGTF